MLLLEKNRVDIFPKPTQWQENNQLCLDKTVRAKQGNCTNTQAC